MRKTIRDVEREVTALLKAYEVETGEVVKSIDLHTIEVTTVSSANRKFLQRVCIETERMPGNQWEC